MISYLYIKISHLYTTKQFCQQNLLKMSSFSIFASISVPLLNADFHHRIHGKREKHFWP